MTFKDEMVFGALEFIRCCRINPIYYQEDNIAIFVFITILF